MRSTAAVRGAGLSRAEKVAEAQRLRGQGLCVREIAERMGVARSTASEYLSDPDLSKHRARRYRDAGSCVDCGAPTDASRMPPAKRCARCDHIAFGERSRERARLYRELIERLWAEGNTKRQISEAVGATLNITTLRRAGYDLPYRRSPETIARMLRPGSAERMAHARAARRAA